MSEIILNPKGSLMIPDDFEPFEGLKDIVPTYVSKAMESIPDTHLEYSEKEMITRFRNDETLVRRLRVSFWMEYERSRRTNTQMAMTNVFSGLCTVRYFANKVIGNNVALVYMLQPPKDYRVTMEEIMLFAMDQEREILALDHIKDDGTVDGDLIKIKQRISEIAHNRLKGLPVHRTQNINQNINTYGDPASKSNVSRNIDEMSPTEIKHRLNEIKEEEDAQAKG